MTKEQENLIMDNNKLVYKFMSMHHLYDEDTYQELMLHICSVIDKFDPERGEYSTWVFKICENKLHYIHMRENLGKRIPQNLIYSLDAPCSKSDSSDDTTSFVDLIEDYKASSEFNSLESIDLFNKIESKYRALYPATCDRDIRIVKSVIVDRTTELEIANSMGCTKQWICAIFKQTMKRLHKIANVEYPMDGKVRVSISDINAKELKRRDIVLKNWIRHNFCPAPGFKKSLNSAEMSKIATYTLGFETSESKLISMMSDCGYDAVSSKSGSSVLYSFSSHSPYFRKRGTKNCAV